MTQHGDKLTENLEKLRGYGNLEENWDAHGAEPFSKELLTIAEKRLKELEIQPSIFPTMQNSIQFEYNKSTEDYLEFEIFEDRIEIYKIIKGKSSEYMFPETENLNFTVNELFKG